MIVSRIFYKKPPKQVDNGVRQQIPPATTNSFPIVYGDAYLGGMFVDAVLSKNAKRMYYVLGVSSISDNGQFLFNTSEFYYGDRKITFDGTDDELTLASVPFPTSANTSEIYAVCQQDALAANTSTRHVFSYGGTAGSTRRALVRRVATGVNRGASEIGDNSSGVTTTNTTVDFSTRHLLGAVVTGTTTSQFSRLLPIKYFS